MGDVSAGSKNGQAWEVEGETWVVEVLKMFSFQLRNIRTSLQKFTITKSKLRYS